MYMYSVYADGDDEREVRGVLIVSWEIRMMNKLWRLARFFKLCVLFEDEEGCGSSLFGKDIF